MNTLEQLAQRPETLPATVVWALTELAEARGKQELYTRQSPQRLRVLREHAIVIRRVLKNLRDDGAVECLGRGRSASWQKT